MDAVRATGNVLASKSKSPSIFNKIVRVQGEADTLSNFYLCPISYKGENFRSVEHIYQYEKAIFFDNDHLADQIFVAKSARQAKKLSKQLPKSRLWDKNKLKFMENLLDLKYEQCPAFRNKLHQSRKNKITHTVPDPFWGIGHDGKGHDHFGILLTKLRSKVTDSWSKVMAPHTPVRNPNPVSLSFSPATTVTYKIKPNVHKKTSYKFKDWSLPEIRKKILIIGDSNLGRISHIPVTPNLVQIESYPGAKFQHISAILDKGSKNSKTTPEIVILSIGINSRNQSAKSTSIPNVLTLLAKAQRAFPNSKIYISQINYSNLLPQDERHCLQTINEFLANYSGHAVVLDKIPIQDVKSVLNDPVHYTAETANNIVSQWLQSLN